MEYTFSEMLEDVHVLLIDRDKELFTDRMVDLLQFHKYKVTTVVAPTAMPMLSKGKKNIDVMIININSPDAHCFELLAQAVALNIITLFICDEYNKVLAKKALDNGAYLYIKRPFDEKIVKYLWQFVLREKIQRKISIKRLEAHVDQMNVDDIDNNIIVGDEEQAGEKNTEEQCNNIHKTEKDVVPKKKYKLRKKRDRKSTKEINEGESQSNEMNKTVKRRNCIKWDGDLHFKFTEAMEQLGEGRCYPADILKVMNVSDLTRNQVSSHLQKCRGNNWRPQEERRYTRRRGSSSGSQQRNSYKTSLERKKRNICKIYGRMPRLQKNVPNQTPSGPEIPPVLNTINIFASSTPQQLHHPQLEVQPHYFNPSLSSQNDTGNGIQKQQSLLFGMLGSENSIFGSTTYGSGLAFNSGDHHDYDMDYHTQNDFSMNLNAAHVTTYSGSGTMSDINVGNAITNGSGATNANFQQYIGEQNMFDTSNIVVTSNADDIEGSNSNEWENCDVYFNFNDMDDLLQNPRSPSATLPNEHASDSNTECPAFKKSKFPNE